MEEMQLGVFAVSHAAELWKNPELLNFNILKTKNTGIFTEEVINKTRKKILTSCKGGSNEKLSSVLGKHVLLQAIYEENNIEKPNFLYVFSWLKVQNLLTSCKGVCAD